MLNIFSEISKNLEKPSLLKQTVNIPTISPSSQGCYSDGKQLGTCLRQFYLDKNNYPKTTPLGLKVYQSAAAGNFWEDWFMNQLKEIGLFKQSQIRAVYPGNMVKGLIDFLILNPENNELELIEAKTYDGSNYYASQSIIGSSKLTPSPKISHLLQSFRYLLIYKDQIKTIRICYIDRACSGWLKNKEFIITVHEKDGDFFPKITYLNQDMYYSYINFEVSESGILAGEAAQKNSLLSKEIPKKEFIEVYHLDVVQVKYQQGLISETAYNKYLKNPVGNSLGDYQCSYCAFGNGTCSGIND